MFSRFKGKPKPPQPPPAAPAGQPAATPFSGPSATGGQPGVAPSGASQQGGDGTPQQSAASRASIGSAASTSGQQPTGSAPSASLAVPQGSGPSQSAASQSGPSQSGPSQSGPSRSGPSNAAAAADGAGDRPLNAQQPGDKKPAKSKAGGIRNDLATPDAKIQSPALMAVLNRIAVGADVSELVSIVCRHVVARPAPALSKQLAYDIVKSGAPGDGDWDFVYAGIRFDLGPGSPPEVAAAALAALQGFPPHRFAEALAPLPADSGARNHRKADGAAGSRPGATGPAVQPSAPSAAEPSLPSMHASASGAAANLAAMDAAIRGSGPSVSGPSASARSKVDASQPSGVLDGISAERSYSTAAGIAFEGSGVTASPASVTAPQPSEQSIAAGSRVALKVRLSEALAAESPAVRAAAVEALGRATASPAVLAAIAASPTPENVDMAVRWAEQLGDALLDGAPAVAAAGAAAVAALLTAAAGLAPDGTVAPGAKAVLPPEAAAAMSAEPGAGSWVSGRAAARLSWRATAGLSSILRRAHGLGPLDQVHVIRMLVALLEYAAARDFSLPPPALENPLVNKEPRPKPQQDLLPSLDPIADLSSTTTAVASGGELAGPWMIEVAGLYIAELLESPSAALQFEAARALLRLSSLANRVARSGHVAAPVAAASRWAPTAVTTILELWDRQAGAGGRAEIVAAVAGHLAALPSGSQPALARQLVPLIAKLPFAAERAGAFAKIWAAILTLDLQQRRAVRSGAPLLQNADLKTLLADPFVMHIAGATSSASDAAAKATYPAFRDEMVMTLLAVADSHPWAARSQELLAGPDPDNVATLPRPASIGPSTAADKRRSAAERESAKFAAEAAYRQRIGETIDWLGSARIALQGTKACLGWERAPDGGLHACTAVVDSWLRLLQRALHAVRALRVAVPAAPEYMTLGTLKQGDRGDLTLEEAVATSDGGPAAKVGLLLEDHEKTLQDLVSQIVTYWKALSPAVAPRALWVAAHHAALPRKLPGAWAHLLDWIDTLLQRGLTDESSKVFAAKQAVSEGSLSARNAFASAADKPDGAPDSPRPDVILNEDGEPIEEAEETGPKEGGLEGPQAAADDAGIAVEGLDAAAAALERLTALLLFNSEGDSFAWSLKELAGRMLEVVHEYINDPRARIDARERLGRVARRIRAVASRTDAKPPKSEKEKAKEREKRAKARAEAAKLAEEAVKSAMPEDVTEASDFNAALAAAGLQAPTENGTGGPTENGVPPAPGVDEQEEELDEDEILAMMRMVPDPDSANVEGYPFGPPPSAVLIGTRRTARYLALDSVVGAAVTDAVGDSAANKQTKPSTQAEVAGLPSLVEVMELVSGQVGGPDSSAAVELTGPADPLRLTARHELNLVTRTLSLSFVLYNRLPGEVAGASVRLASGGPLSRPSPGPVIFKLPPLPGRGSHAFRASFRLAGFGRLVVQPFVGVPLRGFAQADAPLLRAKPYTVSPVALLQAPKENVSAAAFFQAWPPIPYTADVTALGAAAGVDGGLLALSALERSPLARILLTGLPALGGFQAAYLGKSLADATVALVVTGQLLPFEEAAPTEPQTELDKAHKRLAADPILGAGFSDPLGTEGRIVPPKRTVSVAGSRVAVRLTVRSTSAEIVSAIEADKPAFVQDLFDGALVAGSVSDAVASGFRGPIRLAPAVSALKWAYQAMGISLPPQQGIAEDEEAEDGEDEEEEDETSKQDELAAIAAGQEPAKTHSEASSAGSMSSSAGGSVIEREGYDGETSTASGTSTKAEDEDEDAPPPPLPAPDLFDAVAEEWQRLRLAMQDVY